MLFLIVSIQSNNVNANEDDTGHSDPLPSLAPNTSAIPIPHLGINITGKHHLLRHGNADGQRIKAFDIWG